MEENHKILEMKTKFQKFPRRLDSYGNLIKKTLKIERNAIKRRNITEKKGKV